MTLCYGILLRMMVYIGKPKMSAYQFSARTLSGNCGFVSENHVDEAPQHVKNVALDM